MSHRTTAPKARLPAQASCLVLNPGSPRFPSHRGVHTITHREPLDVGLCNAIKPALACSTERSGWEVVILDFRSSPHRPPFSLPHSILIFQHQPSHSSSLLLFLGLPGLIFHWSLRGWNMLNVYGGCPPFWKDVKPDPSPRVIECLQT